MPFLVLVRIDLDGVSQIAVFLYTQGACDEEFCSIVHTVW